MVSGSISLPSQGFFSPFPHGTSSLSVANEYLALEGGPPIFTHRFTCGVLLSPGLIRFRLRECHPLCSSFPTCSSIVTGPYLVRLIRVRSPLLTESNSLSFPLLTKMFQFSRSRVSFLILFRKEQCHINNIRLPHSEIPGSMVTCT